MALTDLLNTTFWNNTFGAYLIAIGIFLGVFILSWIIRTIILGRLKKLAEKTDNHYDDTVMAMFEAFRSPFFTILGLFFAVESLNIPELVDTYANYVLLIAVVFYVTLALHKGTRYFVEQSAQKRLKENKQSSILRLLGTLIQGIFWILAGLMVLSNFGFDITTLIAGLGIGGIAIALALQTVLGDLFASFAIYLDKPFEEGDFIITGDHMGVVKHIGIKTTRITSLGGEEIVISNAELTSTRIRNYKKMQRRRIVFGFGVEYSTPQAKLKKIPSIVKGIIDKMKDEVSFDRTHFKSFGDSSLDYEVVYYVETADYNKYMDLQQHINLELNKAFAKEKIVFAFPTRTLHLFNEK